MGASGECAQMSLCFPEPCGFFLTRETGTFPFPARSGFFSIRIFRKEAHDASSGALGFYQANGLFGSICPACRGKGACGLLPPIFWLVLQDSLVFLQSDRKRAIAERRRSWDVMEAMLIPKASKPPLGDSDIHLQVCLTHSYREEIVLSSIRAEINPK